jgi:hypothetical protein
MAGLGEAASIIAVIQAADRILCLCGTYASAVRDAKKDIELLAAEVEALQKVLKCADEMADASPLKLSTSESVLEGLAGSIKQCRSALGALESQLDPGNGRKILSRFGIRALKWPFKKQDVTKVIKALSRHKETIILALNMNQR